MSNRDVMPWNANPILVCGGATACGWQPHKFVRTDRVGNGNGRQLFGCSKCGVERVFGVVDLRLCGMREVS
jgi:hypothetical protein